MVIEPIDTEKETNGSVDKGTLFIAAGAAMVVFGGGLILSSPVIRRYMSHLGIGNLAQGLIPDIERYFKLRSM
jgi:hypothetical protein